MQRRTIHGLLLVLAFLFSGACAAIQTPLHVAGIIANRALPVLVALEEQEGVLAIERHPGDEAAIDQELAAIEARWAPFWAAWEVFVEAQTAWAVALERGDDASKLGAAQTTAIAAFCATRRALPAGVPAELLRVAEVACAP